MLSEPAVSSRLLALVLLLGLPLGHAAPLQPPEPGDLTGTAGTSPNTSRSGLFFLPGPPAPLLQKRGIRSLGGGEAAPAGGAVPLLSCDFEQGLCGFSSLGKLPWKTTKNKYGFFNGIEHDHTTGKGFYAYPDTKSFFVLRGDVGELVSPTLRHTGHVCVQFAAILTGSSPAPLQLTVEHRGETRKMGEASSSFYPGQWQTYNISFPSQGDFRIHFVAEKVSSTKYTGLDDVLIKACDSGGVPAKASSTTSASTTLSTLPPPETTPSPTTIFASTTDTRPTTMQPTTPTSAQTPVHTFKETTQTLLQSPLDQFLQVVSQAWRQHGKAAPALGSEAATSPSSQLKLVNKKSLLKMSLVFELEAELPE